MDVSISIPAPVQGVLARLNQAGFAAYAVGGCVRDSLLGRVPQDWDICTAARPEETVACFAGQRTLLTGARYGTVTLLLDDSAYEITTFRTDGSYSDCRHPDSVQFLSALEGDLARRDFTINAMAADRNGQVTDLFGGIDDLNCRCIRCVGNADARFREDALRILRALRFSAQLDFTPEAQTAGAIHRLAPLLSAVAAERLRKELLGLLCGPAAGRVLRAYADVPALLMPELAACIGFAQYNWHHLYDVWTHSVLVLEHCSPQPVLRLAALLHDIGKPVCFSLDKNLVGHFYGHGAVGAAMTEALLHRLRFDGQMLREVSALVRAHDAPLPETARAMRRLLAKLGVDGVRRLLLLQTADRLGTGTTPAGEATRALHRATSLLDEVLAAHPCVSLRTLCVNGRDLMALGIPPGPALGRLLQALLDAVLDGRVENERSALLALAQTMLHSAHTI